jgi:hypothetical protein
MHARSLAVLAAVLAAGCGKPPNGDSPTLNVGTPTPRSTQVRAKAGKEASAIGPIVAEVLSWKVEKPKLAGGEDAKDEMLAVVVRFSTADDTVRKKSLPPLVATFTATDDLGNTYSILNRHRTPANDPGVVAITKGSPVTRTILIEKPIPKAARIELDLSGFMCELDIKEFFRFTIPLK